MTGERKPSTRLVATPRPLHGINHDPRGTLGRGIGRFFLWVLVGGPLVFAALSSNRMGTGATFGAFIVIALPWLAAPGLGIRHAIQGRTRTAMGTLVGFGILVGLVVLLMAACFGVLSTLDNH